MNEKKITVTKAALTTILKLAVPSAGELDEKVMSDVFDLLAESPNYTEKQKRTRKSSKAVTAS